MASTKTKPVEDTVSKVNNEIAVGSDLEFQRRWWTFERVLWIFFDCVIVADVLGCFGRGPVAKAHASLPDRSMQVSYERIERYGSPSIIRIDFGPNAVHDGKVQLWVSESVVKGLGNQRISPQPVESVIGNGGITYTFPASGPPASVQFALEPTSPGRYEIGLRLSDSQPLRLGVFVFP